jgi:hypothetical protein
MAGLTVTRRSPREVEAGVLASPAAFEAEVVQSCQPVILRGAARDWPAVRSGQHSPAAFRAYLANFERDLPTGAFFGAPHIAGKYYYGCQDDGFNFERRTLGFSAAVDAVWALATAPETGSAYVGSAPIASYLPGFATENTLAVLEQRVQPRIWLGTASNVSCHYDAMDNIACVALGRRRFTLYSPELIGSLYVGPIDHTMAGQPVSLAASAAPGEGPYPRFDAVRDQALVAELEAGDALYIPKLWWHQVEALAGLNALVNYWWDATAQGPDAPYTAMLLAMICVAERPAGERAAWRAFFDHYVFRRDGHPLAHLPPEQHGLLGPLRPNNYGRIRARVMQLLRGG